MVLGVLPLVRIFPLTLVLVSGCIVGVGDIGGGSEPQGDDPADDPAGGGGDGSGSDGGDDGSTPEPGAQGKVMAYPGGTSIAIRWTPIEQATSYKIERDGVQIATQTPGFHSTFPEKGGHGVIDTSVTPGVSYTYRVTAVGPTTALVGAATATLSTSTTPPPVLTIDTSAAPDLAGWMQNTVKPFVEIWYPKAGDALARPDYVPPNNITLRVDPNYDGVAYASGTLIVISAAYARSNQQDLGLWLHESVHVLQAYQNTPGWITEGIADFTREFILHDREPTPPGPGNTYLTGYGESSYFLAWIRKYDSSFVRSLNIAAHNNTYADAIFTTKTGKTINALWTEMVGAPLPSPVKFTGLTNMCLQAGDSTTSNLQIATCNAAIGQGFGVIKNSNNTISIANNRSCVDVASSATNNGATLWMYPCNGTGAQQWVQLADGSLRNPASNRCINAPSTGTGTSLQLFDCNGATAQRLSKLP